MTAGLALDRCETWTPDAHATPVTSRAADGDVLAAGNGTPLCCGGWQFVYTGVRGGQAYHFHAQVRHQGLDHARDSLVAIVLWDRWKPSDSRSETKPWNYLTPKPVSAGVTAFEAAVRAPAGTTAMTVRYVFRWSEQGRSTWTPPNIKETTLLPRNPVKVCVLCETRQTPQRIKIQPYSQGAGLPRDVAAAVDRWASLVAAACRRNPQLIVTPEIAVSGRGLVEGSVAVPGPATQPFEKLARENHTHIVLGLMERAGAAQRPAVYNSAALIGPDGKIIGVYRKVHLATSEGLAGTLPGNSFPVFDTAIGRIGCLICMDTTVCESARMYGLQKADFICFPIMGDLRADRWTPGSPVFNEDRWKAIMCHAGHRQSALHGRGPQRGPGQHDHRSQGGHCGLERGRPGDHRGQRAGGGRIPRLGRRRLPRGHFPCAARTSTAPTATRAAEAGKKRQGLPKPEFGQTLLLERNQTSQLSRERRWWKSDRCYCCGSRPTDQPWGPQAAEQPSGQPEPPSERPPERPGQRRNHRSYRTSRSWSRCRSRSRCCSGSDGKRRRCADRRTGRRSGTARYAPDGSRGT